MSYTKAIRALETWQPSKQQRTFGVSAIIDACGCGFLEAVAIKRKLTAAGLLPDVREWR